MADKRAGFILDFDYSDFEKASKIVLDFTLKMVKSQDDLNDALKDGFGKALKPAKDFEKAIEELDEEYIQLLKAMEKVNKESESFAKSTKDLSKETDKLSDSANKTGRAFGKIKSKIKEAFIDGIRDAIDRVIKFDQSIADLASITGKSRSEISELVEQAKFLGATTAFSSTQVLQLQTELAKLGFSTQEILDSTKAIEDFSIAVGTDAASAAALAGAAVRSFGLDAKEAENVVSTLAVATTKSALDFSKLQVALPIVGATANAANVSIEKLTAQLGVAADRGIKAETAATALRNIFIKLSTEGITYEEAMNRINQSTNKLNEANKLFGAEGANVALVLAENADQVDNLQESITGVNDKLQEMTDERLDTLQGKLTLLDSAWDGFIKSIESGDGPISSLAKSIIGLGTQLLTAATLLNDTDRTLKFKFLATPEIIEKTNVALEEYETNLRETLVAQGEVSRSLALLKTRNEAIKYYEELGFTAEAAARKADKLIDSARNQIQANKELEVSRQKLLTIDVASLRTQDELLKTQAELNKFRNSLLKLDQDDIEVQKNLINVNNKLSEIRKQLATATSKEVAKEKKLLDKSLADYKRFYEDLKKAVEESDIDNEQDAVVKLEKQRAIALRALEEQKSKLLELAIELGKPIEEIQENFQRLINATNEEFDKQINELRREVIDIPTLPSLTPKLVSDAEKVEEATKRIMELRRILQDDISLTGLERDQLQSELDDLVNFVQQNTPEITLDIATASPDFSNAFTGIEKFFSSEVFKAGQEAFNSIANAATTIIDNQIQGLERLAEQRKQQIEELESDLEREQELQDLGLRNNVDSKRNELDALLAEQENYNERINALRAEQIKIQTAQTVSSIIPTLASAIAQIFNANSSIPLVGVFTAIAQVGALIAAFSSARSQLQSLSLYRGAEKISDHFGYAYKGGASDLPNRGTKGYKLIDADTNFDTNVRISGNEGLVTERTFSQIGDIIMAAERSPNILKEIRDWYDGNRASDIAISQGAAATMNYTILNTGINQAQLETIMRKVLKEQTTQQINYDKNKVRYETINGKTVVIEGGNMRAI